MHKNVYTSWFLRPDTSAEARNRRPAGDLALRKSDSIMVLKLSKYLYGIWAARSLSMGNIWEYGSTNFLQNGIQLHVLTVVDPLSAQIRRKPVKSRFFGAIFEQVRAILSGFQAVWIGPVRISGVIIGYMAPQLSKYGQYMGGLIASLSMGAIDGIFTVILKWPR